MKKELLLSAVLILATGTFAQVNKASSATALTGEKQLVRELKVEKSAAKAENVVLGTDLKLNVGNNGVNRAAAALETAYDLPDGTYYSGISPEGLYGAPRIETAIGAEMGFGAYVSDQSATLSWTISDGNETSPLEIDGNGYALYSAFGTIYAPVVTATVGSSKATYQLGVGESSQNTGFIVANQGEFSYMSDIDPTYTSGGQGNLITGFSDTDFYFGTGYTSGGKKAVNVITVFDQPIAPLYVKDFVIYGIPLESTQPVIPSGKTLTLSLNKIEGNTITNEVIAEATATADDVFSASNFYGISFKFKDIEDGFPVDKNITLGDCTFAAVVSGIDEANVRFLMGFNKGWAAASYVGLEDGKLTALTFNDGSTPAYGLHMSMHAVFPSVYIDEATATATIPAAGGYGVTQSDGGKDYNDVVVYTSLPYEDESGEKNIWYDAPDWITVETDESLMNYSDGSFRGVMMFFVSTTEANEGREADVILHTHAGVTSKIHVIQGKGGVGVSSTDATQYRVVATPEAFELTYPADVTAAAIYNVAGQEIGRYELSNNGNSTIPASTLGKGVYVVKFIGNTVNSVKVAK